MPRPVTDIRAEVARRRYKQQVGGAELPVRAEANADHLCRFEVKEIAAFAISSMPVSSERQGFADRSGRR